MFTGRGRQPACGAQPASMRSSWGGQSTAASKSSGRMGPRTSSWRTSCRSVRHTGSQNTLVLPSPRALHRAARPALRLPTGLRLRKHGRPRRWAPSHLPVLRLRLRLCTARRPGLLSRLRLVLLPLSLRLRLCRRRPVLGLRRRPRCSGLPRRERLWKLPSSCRSLTPACTAARWSTRNSQYPLAPTVENSSSVVSRKEWRNWLILLYRLYCSMRTGSLSIACEAGQDPARVGLHGISTHAGWPAR